MNTPQQSRKKQIGPFALSKLQFVLIAALIALGLFSAVFLFNPDAWRLGLLLVVFVFLASFPGYMMWDRMVDAAPPKS